MLRIIATVLVCLIICSLIKQVKPELLPFVQLAVLILIAVMVIDIVKELLTDITAMIVPGDLIEDEYIILLIRILGITAVTKFASDICKDNGNSLLADNVELLGKIVILTQCLPLVYIIVELASGLLE